MEKANLYIFNFSVFVFRILIIVVVVGFIFSFVFEKFIIFNTQISGAAKINRILSKTEISEIPIFGSSRAEGNFVPSIIEKNNCFNYGIAGTQANIWLFFLENELKKEKQTPVIINFDLSGLVRSDGSIGNYIPNWDATKSIILSKGELYYNIPFVKYYGKYEEYLKYYLNEKMNLTKITDNGGSFEKNKLTEIKFKELVSRRKDAISRFSLDEQLEFDLNKMINSTSRKIIFVVSPYHKSFFNKFKNIDIVNDYLKSLNDRVNVEVVDLRNYIIDDSMFMNTTHLNYEGAKKFSEKLNELLTLGV